MAQSNNILEELKELNSLLADHPAVQVYAVPSGYFENLAEKVLQLLMALNE